MKLRTVTAAAVQNKTVLLRTDYNVPLEKSGDKWQVTDDRRIASSVETIRFLLDHNAKVIIVSHLGRPDGKVVADYSLQPTAEVLTNKYHIPCQLLADWDKTKVDTALQQLRTGQVVMLENIRFDKREQEGDKTLARELADLAEVFVHEAFSTAHRAHASTAMVSQFLPSYAGFSLQKEVKFLTDLLKNPQRPFVVVIGGAKIADKVEAVEALAKIADMVLIGGGIANDFFKAEGLEIYRSLTDELHSVEKEKTDYIEVAHRLLQAYKTEKVLKDGYIPLPKLLYPIDVVAAPSIEEKHKDKVKILDLSHNMQDQPEHVKLVYADIGPKTIRLYKEILSQASTVFWNGPMGVWENPLFESGTHKIACAIADSQALSVLGGGDTLAAIDAFGMSRDFSYLSTGGGAALELLGGRKLPGLIPLALE